MNSIEKKLKEFSEMMDVDCENYSVVNEWLENSSDRHLYKDYAYPESMLELNPDKVKNFIRKALTEQREEFINMIEGHMEVYTDDQSHKEGFSYHIKGNVKDPMDSSHNEVLWEVINKVKSL